MKQEEGATVALRPQAGTKPSKPAASDDPAKAATITAEAPTLEPPGAFTDAWSDANRYALISELARGGGGRISVAVDRKLGRRVALKRALDDDGERRLEREALVLARLEHPAIVPMHDAGHDAEGAPFYTMKLVPGETLGKRIAATTTFDERLALLPAVTTVADAMAYAHREKVIHRDLKPGNVLVGSFGEVAVIDWGLGKIVDEAEAPSRVTPQPGGAMTAHGSVVGTPAYMAPEQAEARHVDARADVYAIGVILYQALSGHLPYGDVETDETLAQLLAGPPPPIDEREPRVPNDLAAIVGKAMARNPADRYPTAAELADDLHRYQTGRLVAAHRYRIWTRAWKWLRRHRVPAISGVAALATAAAIVFFVRGDVPNEACLAADAPVTARWTPAARAKIEQAFGSREAAAPVIKALDDHARKIATMRVEACRAARITKDQTETTMQARVDCLDRRLSELGSLSELFGRADKKVVENASKELETLSLVEDCAHPDSLPIPLPPEAGRRVETLAVIAEVQELRALANADKDQEWIARAPAVVQHAEHANWSPALAAARRRYAQALIAGAKDEDAEAQLRLAVADAERGRDDTERAWALIELIGIEVKHRQRTPVAEALLPMALAAADRGGDPGARTKVQVLRSLLANMLGHDDEAVAAAEAAVKIQRESDGNTLLSVQRALGEQYIVVGRLDDAEAQFRAVIDGFKAKGHEVVPDVARAWGGLATVASKRGDAAKALEFEQQEVALDDKLKDVNMHDWLTARDNLALFKHQALHNEEARADLVALLADADRYMPGKPIGIEIAYNLGIVTEGVDESPATSEAAIAAFRDVIHRSALTDAPMDETALARGAMGELLVDMGRAKEAVPELETAIKVFDQGTDADSKGRYRVALARGLWLLGRKAEAKTVANEARDWLTKVGEGAQDALDELTAWEHARR